MKNKYHVAGMTCATCQAHVTRAVSSIPGVQSVQVNLLTHSMVVDFDATKTNDQRIIHEVIETGYGAEVADPTTKDSFKKQKLALSQRMRQRLVGSLLFLIPLLYLAMGFMVGLPVPELFNHVPIFAVTQLILVIPIMILNQHYFTSGVKRLIKLSPNMDSLIAIGTLSAFIYGIYATIMIVYGYFYDEMIMHHYHHQIYFEVAGAILTFVTIGKYIEENSKHQTLGALEKLLDLTPDIALRKIDGGEEEVPLHLIQVNDLVLVKPGMLIPLDGVIVEGQTTVNQASITGESLPVEKGIGDRVIGATQNLMGAFVMRVEKVGQDTTLAQIIKLVEEASNSKAPLAQLADQISSVFVPIVIALSLIAFVVWLFLEGDFSFALRIAVAILVISCPCALGLATPVAVMVGTGKGAELGILIKSGEAFEKLTSIDTIILDKTGTITQGKPYVTHIVSQSMDEATLLTCVASLEHVSEHPLAYAIVSEAKQRQLSLLPVSNFKYTPGHGVSGTIGKDAYSIGNQGTLSGTLLNAYERFISEAKTVLKVFKNNEAVGVIAIEDPIKPTSALAVASFRQLGKKVVLLTGDHEKTARQVARQVNIDHVHAQVLPQDKDRIVQEYQSKGEKVLMVGDGVNDAPALMRADVGMAIGAGTDIALESADIILMKSDIFDVVNAIRLAKKVVNNIRLNLFWAFFYNVVAIPVAAGLFYYTFDGLLLDPMIAALAMAFSSITVVLNALRLKTFRVKLK
jgi:P-type Cu+ transporter